MYAKKFLWRVIDPHSAITLPETTIFRSSRLNTDKAGRITTRRLTDQAVMFVLQKRAAESSVAAFSPHDFRRTFITQLLDTGADVITVSRLTGHADPATTAKYDMRGEEGG